MEIRLNYDYPNDVNQPAATARIVYSRSCKFLFGFPPKKTVFGIVLSHNIFCFVQSLQIKEFNIDYDKPTQLNPTQYKSYTTIAWTNEPTNVVISSKTSFELASQRKSYEYSAKMTAYHYKIPL